jgi:thiamine pyrophosphate-dependent acetolactate synthase large subunit-like protein
MSGHTVREVVFDLFRSFGMTTIFGNPGSTELPMFRDFPADFRYVLGLQEMVAIGMADGYAQSTRNAGLVNLHSATGFGHALASVFTAYKNQTPLGVTAGQQARFLYSESTGVEDSRMARKSALVGICSPMRMGSRSRVLITMRTGVAGL